MEIASPAAAKLGQGGGIGLSDCPVLCGGLSAGLFADRGNRRRFGVSSTLIRGELLETRTLLTSAIGFSISGTSLITENAADTDNNDGHYTLDYTGTLTGGDTASVDSLARSEELLSLNESDYSF